MRIGGKEIYTANKNVLTDQIMQLQLIQQTANVVSTQLPIKPKKAEA